MEILIPVVVVSQGLYLNYLIEFIFKGFLKKHDNVSFISGPNIFLGVFFPDLLVFCADLSN